MPTMPGCLLPRCATGKGLEARLPRRARPSSVDVAVADEDAVAARFEAAAQLLREDDRAVAAAGAAEGDRQVALALVLVARDREGEQVGHLREEPLCLVAPEHVVGHRRVAAGLRPQLLDEERVREE